LEDLVLWGGSVQDASSDFKPALLVVWGIVVIDGVKLRGDCLEDYVLGHASD
jgi:hypothetical protein